MWMQFADLPTDALFLPRTYLFGQPVPYRKISNAKTGNCTLQASGTPLVNMNVDATCLLLGDATPTLEQYNAACDELLAAERA